MNIHKEEAKENVKFDFRKRRGMFTGQMISLTLVILSVLFLC